MVITSSGRWAALGGRGSRLVHTLQHGTALPAAWPVLQHGSPVGGHLQAVLEEGDAPADYDSQDDGPRLELRAGRRCMLEEARGCSCEGMVPPQ